MSDNPTENGANSTVERLLQNAMKREKHAEVIIENIEEHKRALNGVASTPNGQLFLKNLISHCGVFTANPVRDAALLVEDAAKRNVYLKLIRPYLDVSLRNKIES